MLQRDYRDLIAGSTLCAIGLLVAGYCASHYSLGTLTQSGPGLFPTALGVILSLLGAALAVTAAFRVGPRVVVEIRPALAVLGGLAAFAASLRALGLVPAIVILTVVAALADGKPALPRTIALAVALSVLGTLIFKIGLGLPVAIARWPL